MRRMPDAKGGTQKKKKPAWGEFGDIDVYHEYYQKERKKLGFDLYDEQRSYIGSVLNRRVNLHPEVDGDYLRGLMPRKPAVKEDVLDVLESKCVELMRTKAAQGKRTCTYTIPEIVPGLPYVPPERAVEPLVDRLSRRKDVVVCALETEEAFILRIYWK
jgi:hypothetical protein